MYFVTWIKGAVFFVAVGVFNLLSTLWTMYEGYNGGFWSYNRLESFHVGLWAVSGIGMVVMGLIWLYVVIDGRFNVDECEICKKEGKHLSFSAFKVCKKCAKKHKIKEELDWEIFKIERESKLEEAKIREAKRRELIKEMGL